MGCHITHCPRTVHKVFHRNPHKSVKQVHRPTMLSCWCFAQKTEIVCLQASVGQKDIAQRSWFRKAVCFRNAFLDWRRWELPWQVMFPPPMKQHVMYVEHLRGTIVVCGEVSENRHDVMVHKYDSPVRFSGKQSYWSFLFEETVVTGDTSGYDVKHCFVLCSCGNNFPIRWCTTSLLPLCSCLCGEGVSWSVCRKRETHFLTLSFSRFGTSGVFFWGFVKDIVYCEEVQNVNELRDRIVEAAVYVTSETLANIWQETKYCLEVCHATNGAHIEIY